MRAKGPVVYLAQANGLGNWRYNFDFGPTAQPFQDEFRLLCQKHGIEIDERYFWD